MTMINGTDKRLTDKDLERYFNYLRRMNDAGRLGGIEVEITGDIPWVEETDSSHGDWLNHMSDGGQKFTITIDPNVVLLGPPRIADREYWIGRDKRKRGKS